MRVEADQIEQIVTTLRNWGVQISPEMHRDLVDEFDTRVDDEDLKGGGQHRRNDPDTSKLAAAPKKDSQRYAVLLAFINAGSYGATLDEIYYEVDPLRERGRDSWGPRIGELKRGGWVEDINQTRKGDTGTQQKVSVRTAKARSWAIQKGLL
jgi:hypothetical protein